jgi:hypothetical protein
MLEGGTYGMRVCVAPGSEARLGNGEAAHAWSMSARVLVAGSLRGRCD